MELKLRLVAHKMIIDELLSRLGGKCSAHPSTCPERISNDLGYDPGTWVGTDCRTYFGDLYPDPDESLNRDGCDEPDGCWFECPCYECRWIDLEERLNKLRKL